MLFGQHPLDSRPVSFLTSEGYTFYCLQRCFTNLSSCLWGPVGTQVHREANSAAAAAERAAWRRHYEPGRRLRGGELVLPPAAGLNIPQVNLASCSKSISSESGAVPGLRTCWFLGASDCRCCGGLRNSWEEVSVG